MTDVQPSETAWPSREKERRAYRILDDRRSIEFFTVWGPDGFRELTVAASLNEPGYVAVVMNGGDPELLDPEQVDRLCRMLYSVRAWTLHFPDEPRPCSDCGEVHHTAEQCEQAEWDPTPDVGGGNQ